MKKNKHQSKYTTGVQLLVGIISAGVISSLATAVKAQDSFGNQAVQFPADTTVEFEFKESHGSYQATFGIRNETTGEETVLYKEVQPYDGFKTGATEASTRRDDIGSSGDFLGTVAGGTVQNRNGEFNALTEYTFRANNRYVFYLESVSPTGQTKREVLSSQNFARFDGSLDGGSRGDLTGTRLALEDGGRVEVGNDDDFDDFVIEAGGFAPILCPPLR